MEYYQFKGEITEILQKIGIPKEKFNIVPGPIHFEGYYYNVVGERYIYAYFERGNTTVLIDTNNYDDFKYSVLRNIIKNFSIDYELKNRLWYQDTRRIWMDKSKELMAKIDSGYCEKLSKEYSEVLIEHPFDDESEVKMNVLFEIYKVLLENVDMSISRKLNKEIKLLKKKIKDVVNSSLRYDMETTIYLLEATNELYKKIKQDKGKLGNELCSKLEFIFSKSSFLIETNK